MIIHGVPEEYDDPKQVLKDLVIEVQAQIKESDVVAVYRIGAQNGGHSQPRPILARLSRPEVKTAIFSKLANWKEIGRAHV